MPFYVFFCFYFVLCIKNLEHSHPIISFIFMCAVFSLLSFDLKIIMSVLGRYVMVSAEGMRCWVHRSEVSFIHFFYRLFLWKCSVPDSCWGFVLFTASVRSTYISLWWKLLLHISFLILKITTFDEIMNITYWLGQINIAIAIGKVCFIELSYLVDLEFHDIIQLIVFV